MFLRRLLLIGIVLSVPATTVSTLAQNTPEAANLAPNPSFEVGADGTVALWHFWAWAPEGVDRTSTGSWDETVARTGDHSLRITNESETDVGTWTNRKGDGFIPVEPGQVYTVSVWMMVDSIETDPATDFRVGFASIDEEGEVTYFPAETRKSIAPDERTIVDIRRKKRADETRGLNTCGCWH